MLQVESSVAVDAAARSPVRTVGDDPRSTTAWATATEHQRRLATALNRVVSDEGTVLHHRVVPGTRERLDHLVVGPNGLWVMSSVADSGLVEHRAGRVGAERGPQLYVRGENRTSLVVDMDWLVGSVRRTLEPIGFGGAPVTAVVCFADPICWTSPDDVFQIGDVWVATAEKASALLLGPQSFSDEAISEVAHHLDDELERDVWSF